MRLPWTDSFANFTTLVLADFSSSALTLSLTYRCQEGRNPRLENTEKLSGDECVATVIVCNRKAKCCQGSSGQGSSTGNLQTLRA